MKNYCILWSMTYDQDMNPLIFINHIYLVVALNTFHSLKEDSFLHREFANIEFKSVKAANNQNWEGLYIRGKSTYIELFSSRRCAFIWAGKLWSWVGNRYIWRYRSHS